MRKLLTFSLTLAILITLLSTTAHASTQLTP